MSNTSHLAWTQEGAEHTAHVTSVSKARLHPPMHTLGGLHPKRKERKMIKTWSWCMVCEAELEEGKACTANHRSALDLIAEALKDWRIK